MTKRGILSVALKVLGVILVVVALVFLLPLFVIILIEFLIQTSEYPRAANADAWRPFIYFIVYIGLMYGAGRLLMATGDGMASKMVIDEAPVEAIGPNRWDKSLFRSLMLVIGAGIIVWAVIALIETIVVGLSSSGDPYASRYAFPLSMGTGWQAYVYPIIRIICGFIVIGLSRTTANALYPENQPPA